MTRLATDKNMAAFLDMLAVSEGTAGKGDDGYNVLVGGKLFEGYADHPRQMVEVRPGLNSSAAGRYQLLARYFDPYKSLLKLPDFSPESQDAIAIQQIKESKGYKMVLDGDIREALDRCKHIWASLPGAGYGQHENTAAKLLAAYLTAGGALA